jgi:uncharacterized protein (UPF0128 family)
MKSIETANTKAQSISSGKNKGQTSDPLPYKDLPNLVRSYNINMKSIETANTKAQSGSSGRNRGQTSDLLAALKP